MSRGTKIPKFARARRVEHWGEWEDRTHVTSHPSAPAGLVAAYVNNFAVQHVHRNMLDVLMVIDQANMAHLWLVPTDVALPFTSGTLAVMCASW